MNAEAAIPRLLVGCENRTDEIAQLRCVGNNDVMSGRMGVINYNGLLSRRQ